MAVDASALAIAALGVGLIAFMRGAFGGGFAIVGIPLLSLAMDPIAAGALPGNTRDTLAPRGGIWRASASGDRAWRLKGGRQVTV